MGKQTNIEWCDSTLNLEAGCDGCELWTPTERRCYAGKLTERYGGRPGWPRIFTEPQLFPKRLDQAEPWPDLTGKPRPEKPWLNGRPRMIFLDDMGDTFTESLPLGWLEPLLPRMEVMPVVWMVLTKRPVRMAEFGRAYGFPENFWLMTSVTGRANVGRIRQLLSIRGNKKLVSLEPQNEAVDVRPYLSRLDGMIQGGESGAGARPFYLEWAREAHAQCRAAEVRYFFKQAGSNPCSFDPDYSPRFRDRKGGDPSEWPEDLRVRNLPECKS